MEMLKDREYLVSDEDINISKEQFRENYGENPRKDDLTIMMPKQSDITEQVSLMSSRRLHALLTLLCF